ncbi:ATP-binding protein [Amycolatopsis azurea]|uniref:histidine kinase n=1 Tax=Amycolatopsis azurea DSM 43854 TaxID=1238180 RepID=M2PVF0_9PSEU|nr:ATP-binding protein [Amycolatopsis azurea]EMD28598.1 putative histidine kinase [Amycolatopsis azurea DSM 43854]OOC02256.1 ATP-binding protein [Amycolatopsis azurea DSM 43854]
MEYPLLTAALICVSLLAAAFALLLVRQRRVTVNTGRRGEQLLAELRAREEENWHLLHRRLPAIVEAQANQAVTVPGPLRAVNGEDPHRELLAVISELTGQTRRDAAESAAATLRAMMRTVQNLAGEQQVLISAMEEQHDNPDVLDGLLGLDHANSQLGRRAQATAVLCGSWPGLQRSAATLTDVVRGATGRIRDYARVQIPAPSDTAVVSQAVEPVVLAVAELMDNGARHSQPGSPVQVSFQQAHNGLAIVIDDAGVGMTVEAVQRAGWLLEGHGGQDIAALGVPPRIGFAVIGVLSQRYGFRVSVDMRSPFGGVRAVLFLPSELLTRAAVPAPAPQEVPSLAAPASPAAITPSPTPHVRVPAPEPQPAEPAEELGTTAHGLPRRRRRAPVSGAATTTLSVQVPPSAAPEGTESPVNNSPVATATAWQRGTRQGRASSTDVERDFQ